MADFSGTPGDDTLVGTVGDDVFQGSAGNDTIDGGDGFDRVVYVADALGGSITDNFFDVFSNGGLAQITGLESVEYGNDTYTGIEEVIVEDSFGTVTNYSRIGTTDSDVLDLGLLNVGFSSSIRVWMDDGDDTVTAIDGGINAYLGAGNDTFTQTGFGFSFIFDGDGDDVVTFGQIGGYAIAGAGSDIYDGSASFNNNTVSYGLTDVGVTVDLGAGTASGGAAEGDTLINITILYGSTDGDSLTGSASNETFWGSLGTDLINAGAGADFIFLSDNDTLTGGAGSDRFIVWDNATSTDGTTITDFGNGDRLEFRSRNVEGVQVTATFIGMNAFSGQAGEVRFDFVDMTTVVEYDTNGDGIADNTFTLTNGEFFLELELDASRPDVILLRDANDPTIDDYAGDTSTTGTIAVGGTATGVLETENFDSDWFAVQLTAGELVQFSSDTPGVELSLYDEFGNFLAFGDFETLTYDVQADGLYFLAAGGFGPAVSYTLSATTIEDDYANGITTTGVLELDGSVQGMIDYEFDSDWFAITVTAGTTVRFDLDIPENITVYDVNGSYLSNNSDSLTYTFGEDSTYYVSVDAIVTGSYTLSATTVQDDYADNASTTGTIAVGGSTMGTIDFENDRDWFAFDATAGQSVSFSIDFPEFVTLYDSQGNYVADGFETLNYTFSDDETYYVQVFASTSPQDYTLSATEFVDDYTADTSTTGTIAVGGTATGRIDFDDDRDWFAFDATAGQQVNFAIDIFGFVSLYDAQGNFITSDFETLDFTFADDATYYVEVTEFMSPQDYTLSASEVVDDYAGDASTTGTAEIGGPAVTGRIDFEGDNDWFAFTVTGPTTLLLSGDADVSMVIRDANGNYLADVYVEGGLEIYEAGTYYLDVSSFSLMEGDYSITLTEGQDDYSASALTTGVIGMNDTVSGRINYNNDNDWFSFTVTQSGNFVFSADLANQDFGYFFLFDSDINFLEFGFNELSVQDLAAGQYYVAIQGFSETNYTLTSRFVGTEFDDVYVGTQGRDRYDGLAGDDVLRGAGGDDVLIGNAGDDVLIGGAGSDLLYGGAGSDRLVLTDMLDTANGGAGRDRVVVVTALEQNLVIDLAAQLVRSDEGRASLVSVEDAHGSAFDDVIRGSEQANVLNGLDGDDRVAGGGGNDVIEGGRGNDVMNGQVGDDILRGGEGDDLLVGEAGDDIVVGGSGTDVLLGGLGSDVLRGGLGSDTLRGGEDDDVLGGEEDDDLLLGEAGNDVLRGDAGDDILRGGDGDDTVLGGDGADILFGDAGLDILDGGLGADVLRGGDGADLLRGGDADDRLYGEAGGDRMFGQAGDDLMRGGDGDDIMDGGTGADIVDGGAGDDYVAGGDGADTLIGGAGTNRMNGGAGADTFVTGDGTRDTILDFTSGEDTVVINGSLSDFDELIASAVDTAAGLQVTDAVTGAVILLLGLTLADVTQDDFVFNDMGMA